MNHLANLLRTERRMTVECGLSEHILNKIFKYIKILHVFEENIQSLIIHAYKITAQRHLDKDERIEKDC